MHTLMFFHYWFIFSHFLWFWGWGLGLGFWGWGFQLMGLEPEVVWGLVAFLGLGSLYKHRRITLGKIALLSYLSVGIKV